MSTRAGVNVTRSRNEGRRWGASFLPRRPDLRRPAQNRSRDRQQTIKVRKDSRPPPFHQTSRLEYSPSPRVTRAVGPSEPPALGVPPEDELTRLLLDHSKRRRDGQNVVFERPVSERIPHPQASARPQVPMGATGAAGTRPRRAGSFPAGIGWRARRTRRERFPASRTSRPG